jgi:Hypothetical glycosyl hydrolase family 15
MRRASLVVLLVLILVGVALATGDGRRSPARALVEPKLGAAAGEVRFVKDARTSFDRFTRTGRFARWMQRHFWRMTTYSPYFDSRLRWYRDAWVYRDLYAIYRSSALVRKHPDWILKDASGQPLYIPFDCGGGSCPQYAGDVGNPAFRSDWIRRARALLRSGYRGLFIDDVNMVLRVADGSGREVAPVDPRTGAAMSLAAWRGYVARFATEIRDAFPHAELVHNALWFAGDSDPAIRRQLAAADLVYIEGGVDDPGIHGGGGEFGLETLLAFIDRRHRHGRAVILGGGRGEYALATYLLVSWGRDALSSNFRSEPGNWWRGWDTALGAPRGPRRPWQGLLRRDFRRGVALVNQPDAPTRTVRLGSRSVTLAPASGAVLHTDGSNR